MSRKLFYIVFISLLCFFLSASAQEDCELPLPYSGNTGSNMTVFFTSGAIDALPISSDSPYIVAISPDGLIVGSASVASTDLIGGQQSLAVWGDDTATPEVDGALTGDALTFQLVDGNSLYDLDLSFAGLNSFTANGQLPIIASSAELNCSNSSSDSDSSLLCDFPLPQPFNGNTGQNMTVFFTSESIDSLPTGSDSPYIVAFSPGGLVVGSASFASNDLIDGQQSIAVWGDDTQTPELDGLLANEILTFQLVVGDSLFDLDLTYAGSNSFSASGYVPVIAASAVLNCYAPSEGCTNDLACNYDSLAEVDDGSCLYNDICGVCDGSGPNEFYDCDGTCISDTDADGVCDELEIEGCQDPIAYNYDVNATDPDSCDYSGCTDANYFEYDSVATINDGSCETLIVYGCTDQAYLEYWSYDSLSFSISNLEPLPNFDDGSCETIVIYGCTELNAENYVPEANINAVGLDDFSNPCVYLQIPGCTNDLACNYDSLAEVDDGSCLYNDICGVCGGSGPDLFYECDGTCTNDIDSDSICDELENIGCQDTLAANYDSLATDAGSCDYLGCTDALYFEYDSIATINDGSCETLIVYGCTDQDYLEYWSYNALLFSISNLDPIPNFDNGSCENLIVYGCTNSIADNYNSVANIDNGLCEILGCIDPFAQNTDSIANVDDGSCLYDTSVDTIDNSSNVPCEIPSSVLINTGSNMTVMLTPSVTSSFPENLDEDAYVVAMAVNSGLVVGSVAIYDIEQTSIAVWGDDSSTPENDGAASNESIIYYLVNGDQLYDIEFLSWNVGDGSSYVNNAINISVEATISLNCSSSGQGNQVTDCMNPIACNYNVLATSPSNCYYANSVYDCDDNCLDDIDLDGVCDQLEVAGCTDFLAFNYNPYSTDDGYCEYLGCTDSLFVEFNPNATIDDQSCETLTVYGCLDTNADNYDSNANVSDNSCVFNNITDPYIEVLINSDIPLDAYLEGTDIFIEYTFHPGNQDITVSYPSSGDAIIRCEIDNGAYISLFAPYAPGHPFSNPIFLNSFDFELGAHVIEFTLYNSDSGLPIWEPLVQTSIEFVIGSAGCTDPNAGNYVPNAAIDDGSCIDNAQLDFDTEVTNTGSNHTVYIPADVIFPEGIDFNFEEDFLGAFYLSNGYPILGSDMVFDESINDGSFQVVIFGDDTSTPDPDGFYNGQEFIWAFQDSNSGNSLFLSPTYQNPTSSNSYLDDGIFAVESFDILYGLTGCMNSDFLEYNAISSVEDTTLCQTPVVFGCMDAAYCEYNSAANTDDGSCIGLPGCVDEAYTEFDSYALCDDGSCSILVVEGCTDTLATNYSPLANTEIDVCIYDVCVQFDINNFVIDYSDFLGEIVLSFDVTNVSDDKIIYSPEFEINLNSSALQLGSLYYDVDSLSFNEYNSATISAIITNDSLFDQFDPMFELLSGFITVTSDSVINGLSPSANCSLYFNDEILPTSHLGCTNEFAFNYDSLATINNGSCIDNLNAVVISNSPLCNNDYGTANLYLTGGTPPYSLLIDNSVSYISYSELGIPNEVIININDLGIAEFEGLSEGVYTIEVSDDAGAVFVDSIIINLPTEIQVDALIGDDLLLTSFSNIEPSFYQWLYNGQYIEGANSDIHYPQEVGLYQVYVEDVYGCSDYSDEVFLPEVGLNEFNEHDFKIYPNPSHSSNYLNISQINSIGSIIITNILGQEYNKFSIDSQSSNIDYSVNISEWPNGLYFIILENNSYNIVKRFVKN